MCTMSHSAVTCTDTQYKCFGIACIALRGAMYSSVLQRVAVYCCMCIMSVSNKCFGIACIAQRAHVPPQIGQQSTWHGLLGPPCHGRSMKSSHHDQW